MHLADPPFPASRPAPFETYRAISRFSSLDGLRFICIGAVLWHHSPAYYLQEDPLRILTRGFIGVDFFFVLSGFLITTLLLREEASKGRFSLADFYWRRALRILPVYFLVVTALGVYYIVLKGEHQYLELLPFYYLFLSNFLNDHIPMLTPSWSLSVEEQYYLVWPLLLFLLPRRAVMPALIGLIGLNLAIILGLLAPLGVRPFEAGVLTFEMFSATYSPILIGSAAAVLLHSPRGFAGLWKMFGHPATPIVAFAALLVMLQVFPVDLRGYPNLIVHLTIAICLIGIVIREDHMLRPLMTLSPVVRVGEISYGIYLYHLIALHVTTIIIGAPTPANAGIIFLAYSLLAILISDISFRTYERFFLSFRNKRPGVRPSVAI